MTHRSKTEPIPTRGEIWWIRFDPAEGSEIAKTRPAAVVSVPSVGKLPLRIVVPITGWNPRWVTMPWLPRFLDPPPEFLVEHLLVAVALVHDQSVPEYFCLPGR